MTITTSIKSVIISKTSLHLLINFSLESCYDYPVSIFFKGFWIICWTFSVFCLTTFSFIFRRILIKKKKQEVNLVRLTPQDFLWLYLWRQFSLQRFCSAIWMYPTVLFECIPVLRLSSVMYHSLVLKALLY